MLADYELADYELALYMKNLYALPNGKNGEFDVVLRERSDGGVCVGVKYLSDCVLIAFRGSVTPRDWMRDAVSFLPETILGQDFPLGFGDGMEQANANLQHFIKDDRPIYVVGHSLGAAHATIFNFLNPRMNLLKMVLMGCPNTTCGSVGPNPVSVHSYQNGNDFVCDLPPFPWYQMFPLIKVNGGHDSFPNLFMYHHIEYYLKGILNHEKGV